MPGEDDDDEDEEDSEEEAADAADARAFRNYALAHRMGLLEGDDDGNDEACLCAHDMYNLFQDAHWQTLPVQSTVEHAAGAINLPLCSLLNATIRFPAAHAADMALCWLPLPTSMPWHS